MVLGLDRWKLNMKCSSCGKKGTRIDRRHVHCIPCNRTWDGKLDFESRIDYEKNRHTVGRDLVGYEKK